MHIQHHIYRFFALLVCLLGFTTYASAQQQPYQLLSSLPSSYDGFKALQIRDYGRPEAGFSRSYQRPGAATITIYLYDANAKQISNGVKDSIVKAEFDSANSAIKDLVGVGQFRNLSLQTSRTVSFGRPGHPFLFSQYSFNTSQNNSKLSTMLYVTGLNNLICKVRITQASSNGITDAQTRGFMEMILNSLSQN